MLEAGKYRAVPVQAALGMTGTGKEQIAVLFELLQPAGERITWYGFFTDETYERTIEALRSCGWTGDNLSDFLFGKDLPNGFDREVQLVIEHETREDGTVYPRVRWVNSGSGLAMKSMLDAQSAAAFSAKMKGKIAMMGGAKNATSKPAKDEDIPF